MEKVLKKVKLYKKADFGLDSEVLGTSRAVKYAGSMLYAEVVYFPQALCPKRKQIDFGLDVEVNLYKKVDFGLYI